MWEDHRSGHAPGRRPQPRAEDAPVVRSIPRDDEYRDIRPGIRRGGFAMAKRVQCSVYLRAAVLRTRSNIGIDSHSGSLFCWRKAKRASVAATAAATASPSASTENTYRSSPLLAFVNSTRFSASGERKFIFKGSFPSCAATEQPVNCTPALSVARDTSADILPMIGPRSNSIVLLAN